MKKLATLILLLISCLPVMAAQAPLPTDQAFQLRSEHFNGTTLQLSWRIARGYHLYRERFDFTLDSTSGATIQNLEMPQGTPAQNAILGKHHIFHRNVDVLLSFSKLAQGRHVLQVDYQGCADSGFCYPPTSKYVLITIAAKPVDSQIKISDENPQQQALPVSEQEQATQLLISHSWPLIILGFFSFGLLLSFTPCVLPMIPIISGLILGPKQQLSTGRAFGLTFVYVLSMSLTYAAAGVLAAYAGGSIQAIFQNPWVISSFSLLFVLLALSLFGFYHLRMPDRFEHWIARLSNKQQHGQYLGVAVMGCLASLIVSPCVTAPLVGVLAYIGQTGDALLGGSALFIMGLGMGLPLLLLVTAGNRFLPRVGTWMENVSRLFGILLLAVAIWLLERIVPDFVHMLLWAALLFICSVFLGTFKTALNNWSRVAKGLGLLTLIYGFALVVGASLGNSNPLQPLEGLQHQSSHHSASLNFETVKTVVALRTAIDKAKASGQPVMLDFYADWCISCKIIEEHTFKNPEVAAKLRLFKLLRADITAQNRQDKALTKNLNVVAPPTLIFFDRHGEELEKARIVGEIGPEAFLKHLARVLGSHTTSVPGTL